MGFRIKGVVDRNAFSGAEREITGNNRVATAIGEDKVVTGDQAAERIIGIAPDPLQCCRGINVPEHHLASFPLQGKYLFFEKLVEYADPAGLDYQVSPFRHFQ